MTEMMVRRDLAPADFPLTIVVHREDWVWDDDDGWLWGVTLLPPRPGELIPIYVPPARAGVGEHADRRGRRGHNGAV